MERDFDYGMVADAIAEVLSLALEAAIALVEDIGTYYAEVEEVAEYGSPLAYARELWGKSHALRVIYGRNEILRGRRYAHRYFPCAHYASGVMVSKGGRFVRRKKG